MTQQIRPFSELYNEAAAYHVEGARLLKAKDPSYRRAFAEADRRYKDLLRTDPNNESVLFLRGTMDLQEGDSGRAIALLEKCTRVNPDSFDAWNNLGASWRAEHKNAEALACYERALELKPDEPDILANLCAMMVNEGEPHIGIPFGERCLRVNPQHPQGRWNLGLLYLEDEQYDKGFALYNEGFDTGDRIVRTYVDKRGIDVPYWEGPGTNFGGTIVVHGEQGQGDELLWMQFVPELRQHFERIIIDCHPKMVHAIRRSFPWATVYPTRKEVPVWQSSEEFHFKQSIASLPQWFHAERKTNCGWLKPDPAKVATVRKMIADGQAALHQKGWPVVGIHWIGGRHKTRIDLRSIPLAAWQPIMDLPVTLLSHQYTPDAHYDVGAYPTRILHWQALTGSDDFDWNLALIAASDILVSVNTSAVHAAGAMDAKCWTLTPYGHAWRYGRGTDPVTTNPFYNSVEQYNQRRGQDWAEIIESVAHDLKEEIL